MMYGVYAIKDVKTGFSAPSVEQNDASAMRNFANACLVNNSLFNNFPADFELWRIGKFNTETGHVLAGEGDTDFMEPICRATDFVGKDVKKNE